MAYEVVLSSKEYCDFLKTLPFWKGGTNYKAQLPYNCLYLDMNNMLWADCNNLVKATIWGKATIPEKGKNIYAPGRYGLNDLTCEQLIGACADISTDFSKMTPGECLYMGGHIGTYVGDFHFDWNGKTWYCNVIEATAAFEHGIIATYIDSSGSRTNGKSGESGGKWLKHGLLPWINYKEAPEEKIITLSAPKDATKIIINLEG